MVNAVRREDGGWDALRFVSLTEATEPEHCRRVQIVVGKLPGLPGNRTWSFGPWRSNQGMGQHEGKGGRAPPDGRCGADMGPRSDGTRFLSRQDVVMKGVRLRTQGVGTEVFFTARDLGIEAMDDRLLHHCIHTGADGAGPAPGEPCVGRRDPRAKPAVIVEPLPLPIRPGVTTIGAAAPSLAPSPTAGTDG